MGLGLGSIIDSRLVKPLETMTDQGLCRQRRDALAGEPSPGSETHLLLLGYPLGALGRHLDGGEGLVVADSAGEHKDKQTGRAVFSLGGRLLT